MPSLQVHIWSENAGVGVSQHQQNLIRSGNHTQSSQTLRATSPVLLSTPRRSQTPLELSKVPSESARAFSGAPESTCSYGGAFRMLHLGLSNFGAPKTSAQICRRLREKLRPPCSSVWYFESGRECSAALQGTWCHILTGDLMPYSHISGFYITTRHFVLSYSSLLLSQDLLHHNMACSISVSLYIHTVNLAADGTRA